MADVNSLMALGMDQTQARALVLCKATTYGVNDLVALGFQSELAAYIANFATAAPTVPGLMALGVPALLAVDVEAIINA